MSKYYTYIYDNIYSAQYNLNNMNFIIAGLRRLYIHINRYVYIS